MILRTNIMIPPTSIIILHTSIRIHEKYLDRKVERQILLNNIQYGVQRKRFGGYPPHFGSKRSQIYILNYMKIRNIKRVVPGPTSLKMITSLQQNNLNGVLKIVNKLAYKKQLRKVISINKMSGSIHHYIIYNVYI